MECVNSHWKLLFLLGKMTRFGEVSGLNRVEKGKHCNWLLRAQVRNFLWIFIDLKKFCKLLTLVFPSGRTFQITLLLFTARGVLL